MSGDLVLRGQVESLYRQSAASVQDFPIPLEGEAPDGQRIWQWADLSRADNARRSVVGKKQLIEGEHYLLLRSEEQVTSANGVTQSRETVTIWFSLEGFELWLLMLDTPRGHEIRQFFRECHKRLQLSMSQPTTLNATMDRLAQTVERGLAGLYYSNQEIKQELGDLGQRVARLEEQQCDQLYVCVRSSDLTVKIGYSQNLEVRLKAHTKRGFTFVGATAGTQKRETQIKEALRRKGFPPKNGTEEYQLCPELVEALAQEGLPIGDLCCTRPSNVLSGRKKVQDSVTPYLFSA